MNVTLQKGLDALPFSLSGVGQLAVYNDADELVAFMWERQDGGLALTRIGEPDFHSMVQQMGVKTKPIRIVHVPES